MAAPPSLNITFDKAALKIGETAKVTFTFSAAPTGFTASDVSVTNGTFSGFAATGNPLVYEAVFTPTQGASGSATVSVAAGSYADTLGNSGLAGTSPAIAIDTAVPTVSISSSHATVHADETANITFTFSEAPVDFDLGDVSVTGGTLGVLLPTGNPLVYTTSFTPTAGVASGSATISITNGSYTDAAGNSGVGGASPPLSIQTVRPAATITVADTALKIGETSL
ncbi:MAG: Ig-like domain-containing protein, partial [Phenylobacterium sp.]